jgi:hypothetical protein
MFCPNCGTQNPDTAQNCTKCNFNLKGAAAPNPRNDADDAAAGVPGAAPGAPPGRRAPMPPAALRRCADAAAGRSAALSGERCSVEKLKGTMVA